MDGLQLISEIRRRDARIPVVVRQHVLNAEKLEEVLAHFEQCDAAPGAEDALIGGSTLMRRSRETLAQLIEAERRLTDEEVPAVLVTGETDRVRGRGLAGEVRVFAPMVGHAGGRHGTRSPAKSANAHTAGCNDRQTLHPACKQLVRDCKNRVKRARNHGLQGRLGARSITTAGI